MTNKRITELTALDGDDVANDDVLVIVDVSDTTMAASGTNKKITVAELVTDSALTGAFWPNSSTALTGSNLANGDKLAVVDVGSPDVAKYITADELAQGSQFSSRYKPLASDRLWIPAQAMSATEGTPTIGTLGAGAATTLRSAVLLFDQTAAEWSSSTMLIPPSWATLDIYLWWSNAGAGAGDVVWRATVREFADGETTNSGTALLGANGTAFTAPAQYVAKQIKVNSTAIAAPAGELLRVNIGRLGNEAADTLANDVGVLGIELVRVS